MITFKKHPLATLRRSVVPPRHATAPGFTLVELLVALGLVSLLMLMFAQVFQVATGTMSTQRGIMENDQRARSLTTIITKDLQNRSMTNILPFLPNETSTVHARHSLPVYFQFNDPLGSNNRQGFLSISENDLNTDIDDVLHFTLFLRDASADQYYGKAALLANLVSNPNQPDYDDEEIISNSTAMSRLAEVIYFVRQGNLYRRLLLIRQPNDSAYDREPKDSVGNDFFNPANGYYPQNASSNFWTDFDFSARYDFTLGYAQFSGAGGTANPLYNDGTPGVYAIGIPFNRFGHDPNKSNINSTAAPASAGNPREYIFDSAGTVQNGTFIGRFTQEETSNTAFQFPFAPSTIGNGNPMDQTVVLTPDSLGAVSQYAGGSRRGEDILLSNVHSFDVKVWDEFIGDFVDIGHALNNSDPLKAQPGDFHQGRNRRPTYGPLHTAANRMFDTWHPDFNADNNPANAFSADAGDVPPFVPKHAYPVNRPASGSPSGYYWGNGSYSVGDVILPTSASVASEYIAYRLTGPIGGGTSNTEPAWMNWTNTMAPFPQVDDSFTDADGLTWTAIANNKRLKSLKITIRYLDVTSDQMRQVTLIQSLLE